MITPEEIKKYAESKWDEFLKSLIQGNDIFPLIIDRIGKIKPKDAFWEYEKTRSSVDLLMSNSRERIGKGYLVHQISVNNQQIKNQKFPNKIEIPSEDDYLFLVDKQKEKDVFQSEAQLIINSIPSLKFWILQNPSKVLAFQNKWNDILKVCNYFISNPKPDLYIRELPIEAPTKLIENNASIISALLDFLIPEHINKEEKQFEKRFNLFYSEPLIRFRVLDDKFGNKYFSGLTDISIPISHFAGINLPIKTVIVVENKTTFYTTLTLPKRASSIAIFGGGKAVALLKQVEWLRAAEILYWGDMDAHGFAILDLMRSYFPQTRSVLMELDLLKVFDRFVTNGKKHADSSLPHLNINELEVFDYLRINNLRLEQEKIPQTYINDYFEKLILF